ncbi:AI-2E family transporter [Clostridium sp. ZS2-4]|uniref:AI-2E family transporter n=1 Tax=Clostridium sp. ZS2-4 TaxID=2987703 RepID=UPI00227D02AF|nr:AI-2E family transporter [Clostridium sp. ZS2-4]MCY6354971.1 AI-2E family transporter [Clostridium sp. ZS2-4]
MFKDEKIPYRNILVLVIISYILIKLIDNYEAIFGVINSFVSMLAPFIFAFVIAYILNPILSFLEKRFHLKRSMSIAITYIVILSLILIVFIILLPKAAYSLADLVDNLPQFTHQTQQWIDNYISNSHLLSNIRMKALKNSNITPIIPKMTNALKMILDIIFDKTISITVSLINVIFGLIISIYVLFDKEKIIKTIQKFIYIILKRNNGDIVIDLLKNIHSMLGICIGNKAFDSMIIASICFVALTVLGSPYTLLITIIVGITNMVPYFGPTIGMIVAFIINLFFNPFKAVKILIFLFFLQQFDSWYLDPKLVGNRVGLSPFLAIFAITIGGSLFGVIGMLLAVPTMAVIKIYVEKILVKYSESDKENSAA